MQPRVYQVRVPSLASSLAVVRAFAEALLAEPLGEQAAMVILALDEACANVVKHRTPRPGDDDIDVAVELTGDVVRFRIACFCHRDDVARIKPRDLADLRPGGLGTHFIARIMDRVAYEPDPAWPDGMRLVLEKRLRAPSPP